MVKPKPCPACKAKRRHSKKDWKPRGAARLPVRFRFRSLDPPGAERLHNEEVEARKNAGK